MKSFQRNTFNEKQVWWTTLGIVASIVLIAGVIFGHSQFVTLSIGNKFVIVVGSFIWSLCLATYIYDCLGNRYYQDKYQEMFDHYYITIHSNSFFSSLAGVVSGGFLLLSFESIQYLAYAIITGIPLILYGKKEVLGVVGSQVFYIVNFKQHKIKQYISNNFRILSLIAEDGTRHILRERKKDTMKLYLELLKGKDIVLLEDKKIQ